MAVLKNITADERSLFRVEGQVVKPGDSVEIPDEEAANRAWPKSTWEVLKKPGKDYVDKSLDDAHLFVPKSAPEVESTPEEN